MRFHFTKAVLLGFLTGIVGLAVSLLPFGLSLEENLGLDLLFTLRGTRQAPSDVIIVSIDKESANILSLPDDPRKWSHQLHASLTERLAREGAEVIAFDIFFEDSKASDEDRAFSEAIRKAGNVVLSGYLKGENLPLTAKGKNSAGDLTIERLVPPNDALAQSALGIAPFPLPKVPVRVSQYWTFKTGAGGLPSLPVVACQAFNLGIYDEFRRLMEKVAPSKTMKLPRDKNAVVGAKSIEKLVRDLKEIFEYDPLIAERMLKELESGGVSLAGTKKDRIRSLIAMYHGINNRYLNFYGPPRTITTVPYFQIVSTDGREAIGAKQPDINGKAVFVGHSELYRAGQKDGFYTVFSQQNGLDISGVEIAATAFANLLTNQHVEPLGFETRLAIIMMWGILIGSLCRQFPAAIAAMSIVGLGAGYLFFAEYRFKVSGTWYPVVIPLFIQTSFAFFGAVSLKYKDSNKERDRIRKAFGYYLPDGVVDRLSKNIAEIKADSELAYGICLSTDAEQYTALSETMEPKELSGFMNRYYATIFEPIKKHTGVVANVVGDSMLAIWVTANPDSALKDQACLAALDIAEAVHHFNQSSDTSPLPTRIGLHSGYIVLGHIGAADHYEYRPVGDIVNTATRIEGLNKYLGTRILVSEDVISHLEGFLTRELGKFLLLGKSKPIVVHELLCRTDGVNTQKRKICKTFADALDSFRRQSWDEAIQKFYVCIKNRGEDGPSRFYLKLCEQYKMHPPSNAWDGEVYMDKK
ncbi:Adenylate/guanylate cyclase with Chase sensor [Candidatus Sulfobium mesophilum]|uniref:Adenylate/guanylate cyclase with Chase sensor n=1 Tax=Candidatus Sulfobium mesophilum TaxID=2016548 RepID=A0A2U3QKI6_9BACT|nr:Adenylate/guanylate cyclase with Chase sensor [Candidatus Sulfobium mesophilum]